MRYRQPTVEFEAVQWTGSNHVEVLEFCQEKGNG